MSDDYYVWSCPIKKITKCKASPRLIESQFTVSTRRSFAVKRSESPIYQLTSKSNKIKFESKRDQATSWHFPVPKPRESRQELKNKDFDKKNLKSQKTIEIKNVKPVVLMKCRSPTSRASKCRSPSPRASKYRSPSSRASKCRSPSSRCPSSRASKSRIRKLNKCANRCIQTEQQGVLSHFTSLVDGIGNAVADNAAPWIPFVGATALAIILFGYFSKKVEKAFCIYNTANELLSTLNLNDIPLISEERHVKETPISESSPTNGATVDPHTLRFHYNKLKWPLEPLIKEF